MHSLAKVLFLALFVCVSVGWNLDYHDLVNGPSGWPAACSNANTASPIDIKQAQFSVRFDPLNLVSGGAGSCNFQLTASRRLVCTVPGGGTPIQFIADQPSQIDSEPRPNVISGKVTVIELRYPSSHTFNGGHYAVEMVATISATAPRTQFYTISFLFREGTRPDVNNPVIDWFNNALEAKLGNFGNIPYAPTSTNAVQAASGSFCPITALFPLRIGRVDGITLNSGNTPAEALTAAGPQCPATAVEFDLGSLLGPNMHYYIYEGRSDLPPCDQVERHIIIKNLYEISPRQYQRLIDYALVRSTYYSVWLNVHPIPGAAPNNDRDTPGGIAAASRGYRYDRGNFEARPAPLRLPSWTWWRGQDVRHNDASANGDYYRYSRNQNAADALLPAAQAAEGPGSGAILSPPVKPIGNRIIWSSDPEEVGSTSSNVFINQQSMMLIEQ